jgi:hypothetical protein
MNASDAGEKAGTEGGSMSSGSLVAQPPNYDFTSVAVGSMATATFTIQNTGDAVQLGSWSAVTVAAPFSFKVGTCPSGAALAAKASCTVSVTFAPTAMGPASTMVTLPYMDAGGAAASVVLSVSGSAPETACTSAASTSTYSSIGSGTPGDPYVICNAGQLASLSSTQAAWKSSYRLGADIDLSGMSFTPIGTSMNPFHGTFDGAGHTIANLTLSMASKSYVGLFGNVVGAASEIRHLSVVGANIVGGYSTGIIAGSVDRGRIIDCSTSGTVQGGDEVGGVIGAGLSVAVAISSSHSSATVTGTSNVGGLAGATQEGALVANSYATGDVSGTARVGGLVGTAHASTLRNSYATGNVTGTTSMADRVGGLVGESCSLIQLSFATGNVQATGTTTGSAGPLLGFRPCGAEEETYAAQGATCTRGSSTCPADTSGLTLVPASTLQDTTKLPLSAWDFKTMWTAVSGGYPTLSPTLWDATTWSGCGANGSTPHVATGVGTAEQPYVICSAAQFASLGGDNPWWASTNSKITAVLYFIQMADIDLTGTTLQPIGTNVPFEGVYDGQGYKLSNFTLNSGAKQVALFGNAQNAHLQRIAAVNGNVTATASTATAMIVGGDFGTLNDSYATGKVQGPTGVGGLSGGTHNVVDCYSAANVTATNGPAAGIDGAGGSDVGAFDCFTASNVMGTGGGDFLVAGGNSGGTAGCFYDGSKTCTGCSTKLGMAIPNASYLYSDANAPLSKWDFDNVWVQRTNDYPDLR